MLKIISLDVTRRNGKSWMYLNSCWEVFSYVRFIHNVLDSSQHWLGRIKVNRINRITWSRQSTAYGTVVRRRWTYRNRGREWCRQPLARRSTGRERSVRSCWLPFWRGGWRLCERRSWLLLRRRRRSRHSRRPSCQSKADGVSASAWCRRPENGYQSVNESPFTNN